MTAFNSLSIFHQWLLAEPSGHAPVRTIMLHGDSAVFSDRMLEEIADYLNEYDDDDAGCWLAATSGLVRQVSEDEHLLQLLGIADISPPGSSRRIRNTLVALGRRGHVIIRAVVPPDKESGAATRFSCRHRQPVRRRREMPSGPEPRADGPGEPRPHHRRRVPRVASPRASPRRTTGHRLKPHVCCGDQ